MKSYQSWGRIPHSDPSQIIKPLGCDGQIAFPAKSSVLPFGLGRSYGDSCINNGGALVDTQFLDRFIALDEKKSLLKCEAGISLGTILAHIIPRGWFLPVVPGTMNVTVGGAIANDIHGKNHHVAGSFGSHIKQFELARSDGERKICSNTKNSGLFKATIAGLGLTGLITWAEIKLMRIPGTMIKMESLKFSSLREFSDLSRESDRDFDYTVAWLDGTAGRKDSGRGILMRGNHCADEGYNQWIVEKSRLNIPINFPSCTINTTSMKLFNTFYYKKQRSQRIEKKTGLQSFFFPLDSVNNWNRIYGSQGFYQYQCIVPENEIEALKRILDFVKVEHGGSPLVVLKRFGTASSQGLLSFPRPGYTLTVDVRNRGDSTRRMLSFLDDIVFDAGGALYPAKDGRMSPEMFQYSFPNLGNFKKWKDPAFSSNFWRRTVGES